MELDTLLKIIEIICQIFVGMMIYHATKKASLIAIESQEEKAQKRSALDRKFNVFYSLMQTRADRLSYRHIEALNMIDMEFKESDDVTYAWNAYFDHLCKNKANSEIETKIIEEKRNELFVNLMYEMSKFLNFNHTKLDIQNKIYTPEYISIIEENQRRRESTREAIEFYLGELLSDKKSLSVVIKKEDGKGEKNKQSPNFTKEN